MRIRTCSRIVWEPAPRHGMFPGLNNTETVEYLKVYGTLEELIEYSYSKSIILEHCPQTDHLFPLYAKDAKYIMIHKGEIAQFAYTLGEFSPYDTRGFIEEA